MLIIIASVAITFINIFNNAHQCMNTLICEKQLLIRKHQETPLDLKINNTLNGIPILVI